MSRDPSRRDALRTMSRSAAALACAKLAACAPAPTGPPLPRIPLSDLAADRRVVVMIGIEPIEIMRTAEGIRARSLLCTHFGCRVSWDEATRQYICACHEGKYNDHGDPIAGPPLEPLRAAAFRVEGEEVVVGG